jgi:hypothetical protein
VVSSRRTAPPQPHIGNVKNKSFENFVSQTPNAEATANADQALELTVHAMPTGTAAPDTRMGRIKLLLVLLVCAAPVIASYFTYYFIRPDGRTAYGALVEQRPMQQDLPITAAIPGSPAVAKLGDLRKQWLLVRVGPAVCDKQCEQQLYTLRQLRESMGKDKERVDWVWLVTDAAPIEPVLHAGLKYAQVVRMDAAAVNAWLQPEAGKALSDHLYVVDPMGNWMMRFPADLDVKQARRDVSRLLRASKSWDQDGRQ